MAGERGRQSNVPSPQPYRRSRRKRGLFERPISTRRPTAARTQRVTSRQRYSTGTVWEQKASYSRALRVGPHMYVSGTTAVGPNGDVAAVGDMAGQFDICMDRIEQALAHFGAERRHIVRTRVYLTDMSRYADYARAHGSRFRGIEPVNTMVEVSALVHPEMLIEVEVDAYLAG